MWRCVCGTLNQTQSRRCARCGAAPLLASSVPQFYVLGLDGQTPVLEPNATKWHTWMAHSTQRQLARTKLEEPVGGEVSTVFLGAAAPGGKLWETRILGGKMDGFHDYAASAAEACRLHEAVVVAANSDDPVRGIRLRDE